MAPRASISTVLVRPLVSALAAAPAQLSAFFAATDLTPQIVADAEARISPAQFCVAWAEASRLSGDPTLALRIAEATPRGAFGIVEYVCRSGPTLRDALTRWCRYLGILDDAVEVGLVDADSGAGGSPDVALRVLRESEAPAPASHELCFALVCSHARSMLPGGFRPVAVRFTHRVPEAQATRHRTFFDAPVRFGAAHTELIFPRASLDSPLTTADPALLEILLPAADEKRNRPAPQQPFTDQVRRAISATLNDDEGQLGSVARHLGMTKRSVQRRLEDEGASFQQVRDAMRRELAERYLGKGMSLSEISFLLGFSEPSAFFRAFKRWTGLTPFERRATLTRQA